MFSRLFSNSFLFGAAAAVRGSATTATHQARTYIANFWSKPTAYRFSGTKGTRQSQIRLKVGPRTRLC